MGEWLNSFYTDEVLRLLHAQFAQHKNTTLQKFMASGEVSVGRLKRRVNPLLYSYVSTLR